MILMDFAPAQNNYSPLNILEATQGTRVTKENFEAEKGKGCVRIGNLATIARTILVPNHHHSESRCCLPTAAILVSPAAIHSQMTHH